MQQLLQSQSTSFRLIGLKRILAEAVEELSALMMDDGVMPDDLLNQVKRASFSREDDDDDLMPPLEYHGVTIESELDSELAAELNISPEDLRDLTISNKSYRGMFNKTIRLNDQMNSQDEEIDIWDSQEDAFQ